MSWTETIPGTWERPLGAAEIGLANMISAERPTPREPLLIHCVVEFKSEDNSIQVIKAFRDAWRALRILRSPDVATSFRNDTKTYQVPDLDKLERWVQETFHVAPTNASVNAVITSLQNQDPVQLLPFVYVFPQSTPDDGFQGSIVLFISHWRAEASGTFMLINQMFDYADDLMHGDATRQALSVHHPGSEVSLLTPSLEQMLMPNPKTDPEAEGRVAKRFSDYYSKLPSIDFPILTDQATEEPYFKLHQRTYTPSATSDLVTACRTKKITVTGAVHAAFLSGVWDIADPSKKNRPYTIMMPADARKRLSPDSLYRNQGCWNASQMLLLSVPADQDFITRAQSLSHQYGVASQETFWIEDLHITSKWLLKPAPNTPEEPFALPWFTSLGVLERSVLVPDHGSLNISYVTAWADSTVPGIVLRAWTFRQRLNIHIQWCHSCHGGEQIAFVLDALEADLREGLEVKMDVEEERVETY